MVALPCPEFSSLPRLLHPAAGVLVSLWGSYPCPSPLCLSCSVSFSVSLSLFFWFLLLCPVTSLGVWWALALVRALEWAKGVLSLCWVLSGGELGPELLASALLSTSVQWAHVRVRAPRTCVG